MWSNAPMARVHILGASGSGTTTLGAALGARLGWRHVDSDDLFWVKTQPPFTTQRAREARLGGVLPWMRAERNWVFSGSAVGWAGPLEPLYDLVVYLRLDQALRMARLRAREVARYGARIDPGGDMAVASAAFMAWAEAYDTAGPGQRSAALHALWLAERACRVVRLDSAAPLADLVARVVSEVAASRPVTTPSERTGAKR